MSFLTLIHLLSLSGGVLVLLALLLLLTLAVLIERGWFYFHVLPATPTLPPAYTPSKANLVDIEEKFKDMPQGVVASVVVQHLDDGAQALEHAVEHRINEILPSLDRNLWLLDATVTLAPLCGLLGTIIGMIQTFNLLGGGSGALSVSGHATSGIADALIATGVGLFVAIIAIVGLNIFNNRMREIVRQLDAIKIAGLAIANNASSTRAHPDPIAGKETTTRTSPEPQATLEIAHASESGKLS